MGAARGLYGVGGTHHLGETDGLRGARRRSTHPTRGGEDTSVFA